MTWGPYWRMRNRSRTNRNHRRYYQYAMGLPYSQSTQGSQNDNSDDEEQCSECQQDDDYEFHNDATPPEALQSVPQSPYRPNDRCKRHRAGRPGPEDDLVQSYRRRKPIR